MKHLPLIALMLFTPSLAYAGSDVEITQVKENLHMLVSPKGGNVAVSTGEDGTFVVDDQLVERSQLIDEAVKSLGAKDITFILNTHYHFDHTGGNEFFGKDGAIIVAHDNVRKRLSSDQFITYFKKDMPALGKSGLPVVTFTHDITFHFNGDDIRIIHLADAHTDGDSAAYFTKANVIVAGDTVFNGMYPFIDTEHGGSLKGMLAAHDRFLTLANDGTIIVPGHGKTMSKADLQAYRDTLATIAERVETAIKEGKTLEQTLAAKPTAEFDATMAEGIVGPDAFVTLLYEDLSR